MERYLTGIIAAVIAISAVAFTQPQKPSVNEPAYDWMIYDASGNPTGTFLVGKTETEVRNANPNCNGKDVTCFQNYNQAHTIPLGLFIQKPSH